MNERINLLAEQAGFTRRKYYDGGEYLDKPTTPIESWCLDSELRKFAELIVQECSNFLKDTLDDHFAAEQLEEHFGVEE